ncbi:transcriptional regulator [Thiospirochaeta perfilievii]|uniref:Transcriptional regulator n=2 Tax=Thiospirochaeta perfilievii TaxID=252967 RepID=A0A5C1QFR8_9SPIO|nr:transcriptional regulator [Thiospirochaeta perfilievii]
MLNERAIDDFGKARFKEKILSILNLLSPEKQQLLSLYDIKSLVKPNNESYKGMKVVAVKDIVGSEGRYRDFNKAFLPKKEHLRNRWVSIDKAHITDVILPPIKLYKIGDLYFVRDGNHRVSVAKMQKVYAIDAEVIELNAEIPLEKGMTRSELEDKVIAYERENFLEDTKIGEYIDMSEIYFTAPGRYMELLNHILGHKYFINQGIEDEISLKEATISWYENLYSPIIKTVREDSLVARFNNRTEADLYIWIVKHWDDLKSKYGQDFPLDQATKEYSDIYGKNLFQNFLAYLKKIFNSIRH